MKRYILLVLYYYCEGKIESNMVNYIGVELGVASWQPPHPKNFRPSRNFCRPAEICLPDWPASTLAGKNFRIFFKS